MKKLICLFAVALATSVTFSSCNKKGVTLKTDLDSLSYANGIMAGTAIKNNDAQIPGGKGKVDSLIQGIKDGLAVEGTESYKMGFYYGAQMSDGFKKQTEGGKISKEMVLKAIEQLVKGDTALAMKAEIAEMYARTYQSKTKREAAEKAKAANAKFLEDNKKQAGVVVTASGLQYKVVSEGTGAKPTMTDQVKVKYVGKTIDGKIFDQNAQGVTFGLNGVIPGWTEGIQLMSVGSKYTLFIPYNLAYGETGNQSIAPFSTLIFDVELVSIEKPATK